MTVSRSGDLSQVAISPNGKWLLATPQHASGIVIWDASNGNVVQELPTHGWAQAAFSPDCRLLVISDTQEIRFWRTADWTSSHDVPLPGTGCVAFSPDGRVVATARFTATDKPNAVLLLETETGRLLARLENTPAPIQIERYLSFSPDGRLLVVPLYNDSVFYVWDLSRIRRQLAEMGLDWDMPPLGDSEAPPQNLPPVRIDTGEL